MDFLTSRISFAFIIGDVAVAIQLHSSFLQLLSFQWPDPYYTLFIYRMQNLGFLSRLLGSVSDHALIDRVRKGRALHQVTKYFSSAI